MLYTYTLQDVYIYTQLQTFKIHIYIYYILHISLIHPNTFLSRYLAHILSWLFLKCCFKVHFLHVTFGILAHLWRRPKLPCNQDEKSSTFREVLTANRNEQRCVFFNGCFQNEGNVGSHGLKFHLPTIHFQGIPSRKLTYPPKIGTFESMMFQTSRWVGYVIVPWRVITLRDQLR